MTGASFLPRYAIWNNKGGVGKSFLTFVLSSEYAIAHRDRSVFVIDMCPQANVSEILLGGNGNGAKALDKLLSSKPRQTIGGYFDKRIDQPQSKTGSETSFAVQLSTINKQLPGNMFLVAGDPSLELQAQAINQISTQTLPVKSWRNVHSWLIDLVDSLAAQHDNAVFFIDCNPSFSAYTELAVLASNRLIIPCTADGSSARGIDNVGQLLFGVNIPASYANADFDAKTKQNNMALPSIHLIPLNRSTQYDKKASRAFGAMYTEIQKRVKKLHKTIPNRFSLPINSGTYFQDIPDAHSVSVVVSHYGMPLGHVKVKAYDVHGKATKVNKDPLTRYNNAMRKIVPLL
jgi:cellulose biosynthesis protein BcsQ